MKVLNATFFFIRKSSLGSAICVLISHLWRFYLQWMGGSLGRLHYTIALHHVTAGTHTHLKEQNTSCLGTIMKLLELLCWIQYWNGMQRYRCSMRPSSKNNWIAIIVMGRDKWKEIFLQIEMLWHWKSLAGKPYGCKRNTYYTWLKQFASCLRSGWSNKLSFFSFRSLVGKDSQSWNLPISKLLELLNLFWDPFFISMR